MWRMCAVGTYSATSATSVIISLCCWMERCNKVELSPRSVRIAQGTPALCASMQVSLCVKLLTGRQVETGKLYYYDLLNQEYEAIPIA